MLSSHLYNFRHLSDLKVPTVNRLYHETESVTHLQPKICDIAPKEFKQKTSIGSWLFKESLKNLGVSKLSLKTLQDLFVWRLLH